MKNKKSSKDDIRKNPAYATYNDFYYDQINPGLGYLVNEHKYDLSIPVGPPLYGEDLIILARPNVAIGLLVTPWHVRDIYIGKLYSDGYFDIVSSLDKLVKARCPSRRVSPKLNNIVSTEYCIAYGAVIRECFPDLRNGEMPSEL